MENFNINEAIDELHKLKKISRTEFVLALESALSSAYRKNFGPSAEITVEIREGIHVFQVKNVVETIADVDAEITLEEAKQVPGAELALFDEQGNIVEWLCNEDLQTKVELTSKIRWEVPAKQFGRIAAQTAKQVMIQKIRDAERKKTYEEFQGRIGELIIGRVQRFEKGDIYIDYNGMEIVMPYKEQIPGQRFRQGDRIKALIAEVLQTNKGPQVVASRANRDFLRKLFEEEIPEIQEGVVQIRALAREAGVRTKVAVHSLDDNIDPVGACVGLKGSRIQAVVNEVQGEKIDIIHWSEDIKRFVSQSLAPAKPVKLTYLPEEQKVQVVVPQHQLSLAIGREGQNVRLAAKLTNVKIDITSISEVPEAAPQEGEQTEQSRG
ncbi:MAG: transcription termination/antitermination protein NusA [Candidatus Wallbacteria bacterium]|nr:transcription termination/antitermination protein NusA [Candidatus Wallbacteria bacterium]